MVQRHRTSIIERLVAFKKSQKVRTKGKLATVLFITRKAQKEGLPMDLDSLRTPEKGQVAGLGRGAVQRILSDYGIEKVLAEEAGRTSRGSLGLAEKYAEILSKAAEDGLFDDSTTLESVEDWWVTRIREYFNRQRFKLVVDLSNSVSAMVRTVLEEAKKRQGEIPGATTEGTVLQHLVGAKLELALGSGQVEHNSSSAADAATGRSGDFQIKDTVIHTTTAPSERLVAKCKMNLQDGLRPMIVCTQGKTGAAVQLAENDGLQNRIEIYEAEAFISTNVNEIAKFASQGIKETTRDLVDKYNDIVKAVESDPALHIETN